MTATTPLPAELIVRIASFLEYDKSQISSLSLINKSSFLTFAPLLYKNINIQNNAQPLRDTRLLFKDVFRDYIGLEGQPENLTVKQYLLQNYTKKITLHSIPTSETTATKPSECIQERQLDLIAPIALISCENVTFELDIDSRSRHFESPLKSLEDTLLCHMTPKHLIINRAGLHMFSTALPLKNAIASGFLKDIEKISINIVEESSKNLNPDCHLDLQIPLFISSLTKSSSIKQNLSIDIILKTNVRFGSFDTYLSQNGSTRSTVIWDTLAMEIVDSFITIDESEKYIPQSLKMRFIGFGCLRLDPEPQMINEYENIEMLMEKIIQRCRSRFLRLRVDRETIERRLKDIEVVHSDRWRRSEDEGSPDPLYCWNYH